MPNRTKQAIIETFISLLDKEPLDKITVQEIVTECQISRNTFYYHFGDIYALLDALVQQDVAILQERQRRGDAWDENLRKALDYILENRRRIFHIYRSMNHEVLEQLFRQATEGLFTDYVRAEARGLEVSEEDIGVIVRFYQSTVVGGLLEWMRRGMKGSPAAELGQIHRLARGITRHMLGNAAGEKACPAWECEGGGTHDAEKQQ